MRLTTLRLRRVLFAAGALLLLAALPSEAPAQARTPGSSEYDPATNTYYVQRQGGGLNFFRRGGHQQPQAAQQAVAAPAEAMPQQARTPSAAVASAVTPTAAPRSSTPSFFRRQAPQAAAEPQSAAPAPAIAPSADESASRSRIVAAVAPAASRTAQPERVEAVPLTGHYTATSVYRSQPVRIESVSHSPQNSLLERIFRKRLDAPAEPAPVASGPGPDAQHGIASWYGGSFHGGPTASGERYDMYSMTAAHRTLPMGSVVKVTNLNNGRECVVRINNRGPYIKGRIIDLSKSAANELNMVNAGIAKVAVEVLHLPEKKQTASN